MRKKLSKKSVRWDLPSNACIIDDLKFAIKQVSEQPILNHFKYIALLNSRKLYQKDLEMLKVTMLLGIEVEIYAYKLLSDLSQRTLNTSKRIERKLIKIWRQKENER